jgi:glutamate carboxypeptidase
MVTTSLSETERAVVDWLAGQRDAVLALIGDLVNIDSGSSDKAGTDAVAARLARFLGERGIASETIPHDCYGDALRASLPEGSGRPVMLLGHRDTVFPPGEAARRPFRIADDLAFGPGCADMKAGLAMNAFVLAALKEFGTPVPIVALFTSDEEIGSPSSRALIEREARGARAVFNSEPGRPTGAIVTARKGGVFMRCEVTGKAAHAGNNLGDGISAIEEVARKIIDLHALTDQAKGIGVHVGLVSGGEAVNMVAPHASCSIDLRFIEPADRAATMAAIERIVTRSYLPGTSARLEITGDFMPLVASAESKRLFRLYADCARAVGREVAGEFAGGCADSGFTASVGAPTLCAVGPVGGRAHSPDEFLEIETIVPRAQSLALAIMRLDRLSNT